MGPQLCYMNIQFPRAPGVHLEQRARRAATGGYSGGGCRGLLPLDRDRRRRHVGDIIIDENDIFGDGVNIAARLEGIAQSGGVCISDDAHRQIRGKVDIVFDDMGPQVLKNIAEPMRAWRMQTGNASASTFPRDVSAGSSQPLALPDKPSIAVLPFQNMSGDPEQEYFAD